MENQKKICECGSELVTEYEIEWGACSCCMVEYYHAEDTFYWERCEGCAYHYIHEADDNDNFNGSCPMCKLDIDPCCNQTTMMKHN